jgi:hypothetical protein
MLQQVFTAVFHFRDTGTSKMTSWPETTANLT